MYMLHLSVLQRHRALRTLALDFRTESAYGDAAAPAPPSLVESLANFGRITGLRLSSGHNAPRNQLVCVLQCLPHLRYLDNCGVGRVLSLGDAMGHVHTSDKSIAVQNAALLYHLAQPNVQYVRVDKYIFECRNYEVMHRTGIVWWFLERVRGCFEGLTWWG
ncbi:hypothetical protein METBISCDRAFT_22820 [Metschnikowia bicuspidata]|uniref:Uncharacterized protein n=1 Tax=Metschnikowia bicuspidata TaxID=27322 RepID=A0A4P9ZDC5_9ASCO|nr:hypothetical protein METBISCDRAFT_22820 [Metschnikowia bicuspidata]